MSNEIKGFKDIIIGSYFDKKDLTDKHLYLNIFLYDKNNNVRAEVVKQGYYHEILMYDEKLFVRYYIAKYTIDKSILEHLSNDVISIVRDLGKSRLNELYGK